MGLRKFQENTKFPNMSDKTIRETIKEKSDLLRDINKLGIGAASEILVELSSLLASLNSEIVEKQFLLNKKRAELLEEHKTVAKAKTLSEASEEWREWYERMMWRDALLELIRSLKYYIRGAIDEYKESVY